MAAVTRRQYKGAAAQTTITNALGVGDTSITIAATTGWGDGASAYYVVISPGTSSEEKCLATRSGSTLTLTRAQDDTTAQSHASGATIYPVFSADDADEANFLASRYTTKGDIVVFDGSDVVRQGVGANDEVLVADSAQSDGLKWATLGANSLASNAVTTAKINAAAVTGPKLANFDSSTKTGNYTFVAADRNTDVVGNGSSITFTVNTGTFSAGDVVRIQNVNSTVLTIAAGAGVTLNGAAGLTLAQYQTAELYAISATSFVLWKSDRGTGQVLQVVSTTKTDTFTSTSGTFTDITGLSATITPTSSSSKILVLAHTISSNDDDRACFVRLMRDSTAISIGDAAGSRIRVSSYSSSIVSGGINLVTVHNINFLDSPATTSSTTYKLQGLINVSSPSTFYINRWGSDTDATSRGRGVSTITLMEISA